MKKKISELQSIIDRLCKSADCAQKVGAKAVVEIICIAKSARSNEMTLIDVMKINDLPIDTAISWVQTEKRLIEIDLNQLKYE